MPKRLFFILCFLNINYMTTFLFANEIDPKNKDSLNTHRIKPQNYWHYGIKGFGETNTQINYLVTRLPSSLHPLKESTPNPVLPFLYKTLATYHNDTFNPSIAKKWEIDTTEKIIIIELNKKLSWYYGSTKQLVKSLFQYQEAGKKEPRFGNLGNKKNQRSATNKTFFNNIQDIKVDGDKITIYLRYPHYLSLSTLLTKIFIFPVKTMGGYIVQQTRDKITLKPQNPSSEKIINFIQSNNLNKVISLIVNKQLDYISLSFDEMNRIPSKFKAKLQIEQQPLKTSRSISMIIWNTQIKALKGKMYRKSKKNRKKVKPLRNLKNIKIRQALSLLINRQSINKNLFQHSLDYAHSFWGNRSIYHGSNPQLFYQPSSALPLIKDAGYSINIKRKKIKNLSFTLSLPPNYLAIKVGEIIKENFGKNGIKVKLKKLNKQKYLQSIKEKSYQAIMFSTTLSPSIDPFVLYGSVLPTSILEKLKEDILSTGNIEDNTNDNTKGNTEDITKYNAKYSAKYNAKDNTIDNTKDKFKDSTKNITNTEEKQEAVKTQKSPYSYIFSLDNKIRTEALRSLDRFLFNQYFATLLFEPTMKYIITLKY